jgi:HlyD family secretion protein
MNRLLVHLRSRRALLIATAALLVVLAWLGLRPASVPVIEVARRDLVQRIIASGRVRPFSRVRLGASTTGIVSRVTVREGDKVTAGQTLVILDDAEARGAVVSARAAIEEAQAAAEQVTRVDEPTAVAELRQAEATLRTATVDFQRIEGLHRTGIASAEQLDQARQSLAVARAGCEAARLKASSLAKGGTQRRRIEAALQQARGNLAEAQSRLKHTRITAPADGVVLTRNVEPGDAVQPGPVLMEVSLSAETQLAAQPDEKSLALLRPGQSAVASADAFPDARFAARVVYVSPSVDAERGTIEVRLAVENPPDYLRPDMTVSVDIEVAHKPSALTIPTDVVREPMAERPWVLVLRHGRLERREITLGARGERWTEVTTGLEEADLVVPAAVRGVAAGQRARARVIDADAL